MHALSWPDPFLIAEIGGNHHGSLETARHLVDAAHEAGADAIKTQCFDPETLTIDSDRPEFMVEWNGEKRKLIDLYRETAMPWDWHRKLFYQARSLGMQAFASVFCERSVDHIASLNPCALKIASLEIVDLPLIEYAASKGFPMILSCGMASKEEIHAAGEAAEEAEWVYTLRCPPGYPSSPYLPEFFRPDEGLSDHTLSMSLPACSVILGARIIEKHLTLSRADGGADAAFSLEPHEFSTMVAACREAKAAMTVPSSQAEPHRGLRRSLYAVQDIEAGEPFTKDNVRSIRPGNGLSPDWLPRLLGRESIESYKRGDPISGRIPGTMAVA